jgi:hypothetical protein
LAKDDSTLLLVSAEEAIDASEAVSNSREDGLTVLPPCPAAMVVGS